MKIVYATDAFYPRTHGIAICIDSSIRYLAKKGHEIDVISPDYPHFEDKRHYPKNMRIHRFSSYSLWFTSNKEERFIYKKQKNHIRALLDKIKPDIIHIHLEFSVGRCVKKWAMENNVPLVMTIHTYYPPYFKIYMPFLPMAFWKWFIKGFSKRFYKNFNYLITPSKEMKEVIHDVYKIKSPVEVLPIGIDLSNFKGVDREHEYKNSFLLEKYPRIKSRRRLLFVGRIGSEKNIEFLFEVMKELLKQRTDVELLMVGSGSYSEYYEKMVAKMNLSSHVTFFGSFPNDQMKYIYALADIFTFASVTETQGLVTTEALCNELPVVAVSALGSKSVLEGNKGGFLVNLDVKEFANKVSLLLDNKETYEQKKAQARKMVEDLSFDKVTGPRLEEIYHHIIGL
jgi:1,2-diacylglycerol 3-alpha-glucosyltransferase